MNSMEFAFKSLAQYHADESAGLLLHLPVPLGTTVWSVQKNPACHGYVQDAEAFLFGKVVTPRLIVKSVPFTLELLDSWGKTVFATEAEGEQEAKRQNEPAK